MKYDIIEKFKNKKGKVIRTECLFINLDLKRAEDLLYHALSHGHDAYIVDEDYYEFESSVKIRREMKKNEL